MFDMACPIASNAKFRLIMNHSPRFGPTGSGIFCSGTSGPVCASAPVGMLFVLPLYDYRNFVASIKNASSSILHVPRGKPLTSLLSECAQLHARRDRGLYHQQIGIYL